jgi:hypothetical protein
MSSPLSVRWTNIKIAMLGPAEKQGQARVELEQKIYEFLRMCAYFDRAQLAASTAQSIVEMVPYQVTKVRKDVYTFVKSMDVIYRNNRNWRWWVRVRDEIDNARQGSDASNVARGRA